jgi:SAM-dependent methyltransferase
MEEKNENSYFIDAENGTELVRLLEQDRFLFELMGELLPSGIDLRAVQQILDVGCGPGSWALRVATAHKSIEITGVDVSKNLLEYARTCARLQYVSNLQFCEMDVLQPLDFTDETFDIVNARLINAFLKRSQWPSLIAELRRITHPGGYLCLTESVVSETNSAACQELFGLIFLALQRDGRSYYSSASGRVVDVGDQLPGLLRQGGWQLCETQQYQLDWSWGAKAHLSVYNDAIALGYLLRPLVVTKLQMIDPERYDLLCSKIVIELDQPGFEAAWTFQRAYGQKPF